MQKRQLLIVLLTALIIGFAVASRAAQPPSASQAYVDPACIADDENFVNLFDVVAVSCAALGGFLLPLMWPFLPRVTNSWTWASPYRRWTIFAGVFSGIFFLPFFLPPQLSRVHLLPRDVGMYFFSHVGNVRPEYLACDLTSIPRDYGFLFALGWNPGPNSLIQYWWAQVAVYAIWVAIFGAVYLLVTTLAPARRLEVLGR